MHTKCVIMCSLESLKVDLRRLKDEVTTLTFNLNDAYFEALDGADVKQGSLHVSVSIRKATGFFEFRFHTAGTVIITCDRCLDEMEQPVETDNRLIVKLGSDYSEEDDLVVIPENEGILDMTWFIYEFVALVIPIRHVHAPGKCNPAMTKPIRHVHAPGKCNPAMTKALEELSADRSSDEESDQPTDSRWDKLKTLKMKD